jgi:hypothetical protein
MKNITIVTGWDDTFNDIGKLTMCNRSQYAMHFGYGLRVEHDTDPKWNSWPVCWRKLDWTRKALQHDGWVWWHDADVLVTALEPIEDVIAQTDKPIILAKDENGTNIGSYLIKDTLEAHQFIGKVLSLATAFRDAIWFEQSAWMSIENDYDHLIHVVDKREINSYPKDWQPGDRVCHFAGENPDRLERMKTWMKENDFA